MRTSDEPNRRVQDGPTCYWLCWDCEQKFSAWERQFACAIFRPVTEDGTCNVHYSEWLLKFCVSISWRLLLLAADKTSLVELPEQHQSAAEAALETWARFLRGEIPHPGRFEQHLLVLDSLGSYRGLPVPPNINRYAMRSIEIDAGWTDKVGFTFAKMGPVALLGFYYLPKPGEWSGGKVHVKRGVLLPTKYKLPEVFLEYLIGRARRYGGIMDQLSERQLTIADKATTEALQKNKDNLSDLHWTKAVHRDVDMFGEGALGIGFPSKDKPSE